MKLPKIPTDDLILFGSVAGFSTGAAVTTGAMTDNWLLAFGIALVVFGIFSFLVTFLAAGASE